MPSHLSDIGFHVESDQDFEELALQACREGQTFPNSTGTYVRWAPGAGVELWAQLDQDDEVIGLNPHFQGESSMKVGLTERVSRPNDSPLDGAFYAWANPQTDDPQSGEYPFVFDVPNYQLCNPRLPTIVQVQLAAFAHSLETFESEAAYEQSQSEVKFASQSFIPAGLFTPDGEMTEPPQAHAIFTGHVLETSLITNPVTDAIFCWARVQTLGGEVDVVADPETLEGTIVKGGVLSGSFWLSGIVLTP